MMQRFTDDAQRVLSFAQEAALELGHDYVGTEHVLIGLTKVKNGVAAKALEELGIVTEDIFEAVEDQVGRGNKKATSIYMTPRVKNVLELAVQVANRMNHNYVGTEHILLGLLSDGGGVAVGILRAMNIRTDDIVEAIRHILGSSSNGDHSGQEGANNNGDLGELTDFAYATSMIAELFTLAFYPKIINKHRICKLHFCFIIIKHFPGGYLLHLQCFSS